VHFPARDKAVRIESPGRYLAPGGALAAPVLASHLDGYEARLSPVFPNNLVQLALRESGDIRFYGGATDDLTGKGIGLTNALPPPEKGEPVRGTVELRAWRRASRAACTGCKPGGNTRTGMRVCWW
jgi:hypothetical protein